MPWLVRDGEVLATLEVAESARDRGKGLLGRDDFDGAILLRPARSVHTLGMRFAIDVAFVDGEMTVLKVVTMKPWRLGAPVFKASAAIEAKAGAFRSWSLTAGDKLEIKG